ncbi:hypothetical protein D3C80_1456700 [compost metagenome]
MSSNTVMTNLIEFGFGRYITFGGIEIHAADAMCSPFPLRLLQYRLDWNKMLCAVPHRLRSG